MSATTTLAQSAIEKIRSFVRRLDEIARGISKVERAGAHASPRVLDAASSWAATSSPINRAVRRTSNRDTVAIPSAIRTNSSARNKQRRPVDAGARGLAELVRDHRRDRVARLEQRRTDVRAVPDDQRDGDRLTERAAETEHPGADDPGPSGRQHAEPDRLVARRAEGHRALARIGRHDADHLARDRRHDRQDHDREDHARSEHVAARALVAEEPADHRDLADRRREPWLDGAGRTAARARRNPTARRRRSGSRRAGRRAPRADS